MADKSTLRKMIKQIIHDILSTMHSAVNIYFDGDNCKDFDYAAQTINLCIALLNSMNF